MKNCTPLVHISHGEFIIDEICFFVLLRELIMITI